MSIDGTGSQDGSDWSNAFESGEIETVLDQIMQPGDTLFLGGPTEEGGDDYGDLRFSITSSGTESKPKSLIGVDRGYGFPMLKGTQKVRSYVTIQFKGDSSFWTVQNIRIERRDIGLNALEGRHQGLVFDNVIIRHVREAAFRFQDCDNLMIRNCRAERYSNVGFQFTHSCDGVTLEGAVADCSGTSTEPAPEIWKHTSDPVGFDFHRKGSSEPENTRILLRNCVSINNRESNGDSYEQGDGFKFERNNRDIVLVACVANWNRDAGFDLKGTNQKLEGCVAVSNSRYGFKVWYDGILENCVAVGNRSRQLTLPSQKGEHTIVANYCTFHAEEKSDVGVGTEAEGTTGILNHCILSFSGESGRFTMGPGTVTLNESVTLANAGNPEDPPRYLDPVLPWTGLGDHFDNRTYGRDKGYSSERVEQIFANP